MSNLKNKPMRKKAFGSIPHLPGSKYGNKEDKGCPEGFAKILTEKTRDELDHVIVTEKLDGSCTGVIRYNGEIIPLVRSGHTAYSSPWKQHHLFADWVRSRETEFNFLDEGSIINGEWIAQAHGTVYDLTNREPWIVFDMRDRVWHRRLWTDITNLCHSYGFEQVPTLYSGYTSCSIEKAMSLLGVYGHYGALEQVEGCVWRLEREDKVEGLAKYVREKAYPGRYLPEISGSDEIWNWIP